MEKIAPRSSDDVTPSVNKQQPFYKSTNNRSNPAFVTVSHITTSAEITNPTTPNKFRSGPIPQPLLINNNNMSSMSVDDSTHSTCPHSQLPPTSDTPSPVKQQMIPTAKKMKSFFAATQHSSDEYASSLGSESTPPHSNTPLFSPKYAYSPPAGSGGKYMIKSKRTSWIIDAGASSSTVVAETNTSTPTTPISLPTTSTRSRKSSTVDKRFILSLDESPTTTTDMHYNKSGSISKLRENRSPKLDKELDNHHNRNSSISSILTDNISMISCSDEYESSNDCDSMSNSNKCTCYIFCAFFSSFLLTHVFQKFSQQATP
jgi:hypothetical protein